MLVGYNVVMCGTHTSLPTGLNTGCCAVLGMEQQCHTKGKVARATHCPCFFLLEPQLLQGPCYRAWALLGPRVESPAHSRGPTIPAGT